MRGLDRPAAWPRSGDQRADVLPRSTGSRSAHVPQSTRGRRRGGVPPGPPRPGGAGRGPRSTSAQQLLLRLHDLLLDRQDEIIDLICWESGKARKHAFDEPLHVALTARYYGRTGHRAPRHQARSPASSRA